MSYCILDIETVPHPDAHMWAEPVRPDSRLVDPVKIAKSIEEKTAERDERFGLDADCNRIAALGFVFVGHGDPTVYLMRDEFEERQHLQVFGNTYRKYGSPRIVTFNGLKFDLPVLMRRAMYLDIQDFPEFNLDRYRTPHIDLWQKLSHNGLLTAHSLKFYAKRMGFTTLDKVEGSEIAQLVKEERWAEVEAHCLSDIGLTHALANRLGLLKIGVAA
jgi:predicted PolB exonuclease-like 3'-5' exonuclease